MVVRFFGMVVLCCACAACTQFPELDATVSEDAKTAETPALLPVETILASARATPAEAAPEMEEDLRNRAAELRARAERLRKQ
ncbi:MAG: hypothetical protein HRU30_03790 [Rhodobacteraceae bacterium]|nr:hypothetical protein [Paracoccaceae bacterium]